MCRGVDDLLDFASIEAVHRGTKSRGFRGAMLNPVQEAAVVNFHAVLDRYLSRV